MIAKASNYIVYANGNLASQKFIDKEVLDDPAVYPDAETAKKLFVHMPYQPKVQACGNPRMDQGKVGPVIGL